MSRVGKRPIPIPDGTEVRIQDQKVSVKGKLGALEMEVSPAVAVEQKDKQLLVTPKKKDDPRDSAMHGMTRARLANLITGVSRGFTKDLEIHGLGYKAAVKGETLTLSLGFSHPVEFTLPKGVKVAVDKKATKLSVSGIDKDVVGQTAASIRSLKRPEPYKGAGIRYVGERVRRKAGKTAAGAGGAGGKK